jgi:hypothetical protein
MPGWKKTSDIKAGSKFVFQPIELDGKETFSLWDLKEKRFVKSGETIKTAKGMQEVNKFIKLSEEDKKRYGRNLKYRRQIVVDGKLFNFDVPQTVETALKNQMNSITEDRNEDPLHYTYSMKREGEGLKTTYFVNAVKNVGEAIYEDGDSSPSSSSFNEEIPKQLPQSYSLSPRQLNVINKIKEDKITDEVEIYRVLKRYGFGLDLANEIIKKEFGVQNVNEN